MCPCVSPGSRTNLFLKAGTPNLCFFIWKQTLVKANPMVQIQGAFTNLLHVVDPEGDTGRPSTRATKELTVGDLQEFSESS